MQWGAVERRGKADIRQQPDHDVFGAGGLQCLHAVGQAVGGGTGLGQAGDATLQEVVTATGQVIQCIRVGTEVIGRKIAGPGAFAGGGDAGNRIKNLVGTIAAYSPVITIRQAFVGANG
ncbi:hypothetical protein D3C76_1150080 [compost metagenome]